MSQEQTQDEAEQLKNIDIVAPATKGRAYQVTGRLRTDRATMDEVSEYLADMSW